MRSKTIPKSGYVVQRQRLTAKNIENRRISQIIEITQQLQNNAQKRQITNAHKGLVHNMSAAATSSTVLILES